MKYLLAALLFILICCFLHMENTKLDHSHYSLSYEELPSQLEGFRICHLSDIHNTHNRKLKESILKAIKANHPDIIVITGDLIDSRRTDAATAVSFAAELVKLAPVYFIPGNHESRKTAEFYRQFTEKLQSCGVTVLNDENTAIEKEGQTVNIIGLKDPCFHCDHPTEFPAHIKSQLHILKNDKAFNIVLSHRPELFTSYAEENVSLVLSGHAHGGQVRLPFIGGLYSPGQGILPQYTAGVHTENKTKMVISRGIGNSLFPFRVFDHPEIIFITLSS